MKKVFMSVPMKGYSDEDIRARMDDIKAKIKADYDDVEFIDSMVHKEPPAGVNVPAWYLSESISYLATADLIYFGDGWKEARGCKIEHLIAEQYGIGTIIHD